MQFRWPFVRRSTYQVLFESARQQVGDLQGKLNLAAMERVRLEDELSRLRVHFDDTVKAKDAAYTCDTDYLRYAHRTAAERAERAEAEIRSLGILTPFDWAYPGPIWATVTITADINGIVPGLESCPTSAPSPIA